MWQHFASVCRTKRGQEAKASERESSSQHYFLGSVQCEDPDPAWRVTLPILGKNIDFKIDSGADTSIMSEGTNNAMGPRPNLKPITTLHAVGGQLVCREKFVVQTEVK